jgi:DNA-binding Lrp family transcriptional regulator
MDPQPDRPADGVQRRLAWLSLDYLLDSIELSRGGEDVLDRLILAALLDANMAPVKQQDALQIAYAGLDDTPPDEMRRPISINAIAQSLGLSFETVRRRLRALERAGACTVTARGVIAAPSRVEGAAFKAMSVARYERLRRFRDDLLAAGAMPPVQSAQGAPPRPPPERGAPVRVANRFLAEYLMRMIAGVMRHVPSPVAGLVLLHMVEANTEHLPLEARDAPLGTLAMRPVTMGALAARMGMPAETVRRRAVWLEGAGFCRRSRAGAVIRPEAFTTPQMLALAADNATNVQRLFTRLERFGILELWDAEAGDGQPRAANAEPSTRKP